MKLNDLKKTPEFLENVLETVSDGLMLVNREGTILSFNLAAEQITGYRREEVIGKPCAILDTDTCVYREGDRTTLRCSLFENGHAVRKNCRIRAKDGREIHLLKNAIVLRDEKGAMIGGIETMTDVTSLVVKDRQLRELGEAVRLQQQFKGLVGRSPVMLRVYEQIRNAAGSEAPVIIFGESGTGKELAAAAVHSLSRRKDGPFVKVNCAALNEGLLESELFGHRKGSFTGAVRDREGRFEAASGGTIFLDEIGDTTPALQSKLLRVLEEKVIERVGDNAAVPVDIHLVSATNRNLETLVEAGLFREDLLYRVNAIPITLPPLRERADDIPPLISHFLTRIGAVNGRTTLRVTAAALESLQTFRWPGNVRQLINALEYAAITCRGGEVDVTDLPAYLSAVRGSPTLSFRRAITREMVQEALTRAAGRRAVAAGALGVSRMTLWKKMKKWGLHQVPPPPREG